MKRMISVFLTVAMLFAVGSVGSFAAGSAIKVTVNGNPVAFDQAPVNQNGMVFVPVRAILEAYGQKVDWDSYSKKVTATDPVTGMVTVIDLNSTLVTTEQDGVERSYEMTSAPLVLSGRTLIPVRSISEIFCRDVKWDQNAQTVVISEHAADKNMTVNSTAEAYSGQYISVTVIQPAVEGMTWKMHKNDNVIWISQKEISGGMQFLFKIQLSEDAEKSTGDVYNESIVMDYVNSQGTIIQQQKQYLKITEASEKAVELKNGAAVDVKVGDLVKVVLKDNSASTGYTWYATSQPQGLELVEKVRQKKSEQSAGDQMVGAPLNMTYVYRVNQAGTMTLKFDSMRSWSGEKGESCSYTINAK